MEIAVRENPLRMKREAAGLSRADLARRSGASYIALTMLETGLPRRVSKKTAGRISPFLNMGIAEMQEAYATFRDGLLELREVAA